MTRYAIHRKDSTQDEIVSSLEAVGWQVWVIGKPCDLLCFRAGIWKTLECKPAKNKRGDPKIRKDQQEQNDFCELTGTPRVASGAQAIAALSREV